MIENDGESVCTSMSSSHRIGKFVTIAGSEKAIF